MCIVETEIFQKSRIPVKFQPASLWRPQLVCRTTNISKKVYHHTFPINFAHQWGGTQRIGSPYFLQVEITTAKFLLSPHNFNYLFTET